MIQIKLPDGRPLKVELLFDEILIEVMSGYETWKMRVAGTKQYITFYDAQEHLLKEISDAAKEAIENARITEYRT